MWWLFGIVGVVGFAYVLIVLNSNYTVKKLIEENFEKMCSLGLTGAQFAFAFLKMSNVNSVEVQYSEKDGLNFYIPKKKIIVLEKRMCYSNSLSSIAIAGHEVAHAIQHANGEFAWGFNRILRVFNLIFSFLLLPMLVAGLILLLLGNSLATILFIIGAVIIALMILLKISTIFVESSASKKAIIFLKKHGELKAKELREIKTLLKYAELTYVSDLFTSIFNFKKLTKL